MLVQDMAVGFRDAFPHMLMTPVRVDRQRAEDRPALRDFQKRRPSGCEKLPAHFDHSSNGQTLQHCPVQEDAVESGGQAAGHPVRI